MSAYEYLKQNPRLNDSLIIKGRRILSTGPKIPAEVKRERYAAVYCHDGNCVYNGIKRKAKCIQSPLTGMWSNYERSLRRRVRAQGF
jgi:hypothetical protein